MVRIQKGIIDGEGKIMHIIQEYFLNLWYSLNCLQKKLIKSYFSFYVWSTQSKGWHKIQKLFFIFFYLN